MNSILLEAEQLWGLIKPGVVITFPQSSSVLRYDGMTISLNNYSYWTIKDGESVPIKLFRTVLMPHISFAFYWTDTEFSVHLIDVRFSTLEDMLMFKMKL